jgi:transposase
MAFLREDIRTSGTYLRIVQSKRVNGKNTHVTLLNLGKKEDYKGDQLKNIAIKLYKISEGNITELIDKTVKELGRFNYGYYQLYRRILGEIGIDRELQRIRKRNKLNYDPVNAVMLMLVERLNDPASKRRNYFNQDEYIGIKKVELHQLYRTLDNLADNALKIQDVIYNSSRNLFNSSLDIVFYDVTTFYFESEREEGLRRKGFSKDGKMGKTQVVFGLLIDRDKQPIGYQIYQGDFYEGHTFKDAVDKLKKRYNIAKVIVVADRGMLSKENLECVTSSGGFEFIVGERLKKLPEKQQEYLLDRKNYKSVWTYNRNGEEIQIEYTTIEYSGRKIIGTYSAKRARKDVAERAERLEKTNYLLKNQTLIKSKARRYYLKEDNQGIFSIDEDKLARDARFDGFIAIATSNMELSEPVILDHYKHLYRIEHSFRSFKSHLETRPMFHWTDKRIEGHICLCYIAYALLSNALLVMEKSGMKISEDELRRLLDKMQVSLIEQKKEEYYLRSRENESVEKLSTVFKLNQLPNISPKSSIGNYL